MSSSFATGLGTVLFDHLVDAGEERRWHVEAGDGHMDRSSGD
jgi:hypothetical protein